MNANEFLKFATDPEAWLEKSLSLRSSADRLWENFFKVMLEAGSCGKEEKQV